MSLSIRKLSPTVQPSLARRLHDNYSEGIGWRSGPFGGCINAGGGGLAGFQESQEMITFIG